MTDSTTDDPQSTTATKRCSTCGEIKPENAFSIDRHSASGLYAQCQTCVNHRRKTLCYAPRSTGTKICHKCGLEKSVKAFPRNRRNQDGLLSWCKICVNDYQDTLCYTPPQNGTKTCSKCGATKNGTDFHRNRHNKDGLHAWCKTCASQYMAQWSKHNPDKCRSNVHRHRARKRGNGGTHTPTDVRRQGEVQRWRCWWRGPGCAVDCTDDYEVDHLVPLSKGGHNGPSNIVISCPHCNRSKKNKLPADWIGRLF